MVKSNLRFRYGNLHIASPQGREERRDSKALRRGPKIKAEDCGQIDTYRGRSIAYGDNSGIDASTPQKFAARRAEKFLQGGQLCLAALELAYIFGGIAHAPRGVISDKMLPQVKRELRDLQAFQDKPEAWGNGKSYWDDYCLCRFLEGVCERYLAYPVCGDLLLPLMFLDSYCRIQTLYQKMMTKMKLTLVPGNARKSLSRKFWRMGRRSKMTIIWFSTLVCPC